MKCFAILMTFTMSVVLAAPAGVSAKEYNKRPHLDPGSQAKVNSATAAGARDKNETLGTSRLGRIINQGCAESKNEDSGDSNPQPREVIIVGRDIINIGGDC